jgi:hypothetical protein
MKRHEGETSLETVRSLGWWRLTTWTPAAAGGYGQGELDGEGDVTVVAIAAVVPTSRVGLGRLEDQESADGARGRCGRVGWLQNTNNDPCQN